MLFTKILRLLLMSWSCNMHRFSSISKVHINRRSYLLPFPWTWLWECLNQTEFDSNTSHSNRIFSFHSFIHFIGNYWTVWDVEIEMTPYKTNHIYKVIKTGENVNSLRLQWLVISRFTSRSRRLNMGLMRQVSIFSEFLGSLFWYTFLTSIFGWF